MYSHVACDVMKERTLYLLKPSSLIWHLMPYLFLFTQSIPTFHYFFQIFIPTFLLKATYDYGDELDCHTHQGKKMNNYLHAHVNVYFPKHK